MSLSPTSGNFEFYSFCRTTPHKSDFAVKRAGVAFSVFNILQHVGSCQVVHHIAYLLWHGSIFSSQSEVLGRSIKSDLIVEMSVGLTYSVHCCMPAWCNKHFVRYSEGRIPSDARVRRHICVLSVTPWQHFIVSSS